MIGHARAVALIGVIVSTVPSTSAAQWRVDDTMSTRFQTAPTPPPSPVVPTLLSLAIPGAGQHVLGQNRKWLYLALEVAGWTLWVERRFSAGDASEHYRDFAWERGRIQSDPRIDGDFDYYERLTKWMKSGAFDVDPGAAGVQPEPDGSTYNGSVWSLASQIYLPPGENVPETDPAYQSALRYYQERAYGNDYLWDWSGAPDDQQELAHLIGVSDSIYGQATTVLGVVIANHLVSAVDAYLSARSGRASRAQLRVVPGDGFGSGSFGPDWLLVLSVGVGR